jgi:hypothetical protein
MKVALEGLDTKGLVIEMPMGEPRAETRVAAVRRTRGLAGLMVAREGALSVSGLAADALELDSLLLDFGTVVVDVSRTEGEESPPGLIRRLEGGYEQHGDELKLDLHAGEAFASRLTVDVLSAGARVSGEVRIDEMRLSVDGGSGRIEGKRVEIVDFKLRWGEMEVSAPRAEAEEMVIGWGEGFLLEAATLQASDLDVTLGSPRAKLVSRGVRLEGLRIFGGEVDLRAAAVETLAFEASFTGEGEPETGPSAPREGARTSPFVDLAILDGLGGELNVNLFVDISVPVIGSRRATHRFRIPVKGGTLDYIGLEDDLSTLESALLDFAVRSDDTLVLEVGIPLLPTRGRGKPIVAWDLTPEDRSLAERNRIRLALLPSARPANEAPGEARQSEAGRGKDDSAFALRQLGFRSVEATFELAPVSRELGGYVEALAIGRASIRGDLHHDPRAPTRPGELLGDLRETRLALRPLPVGSQTLTVSRLQFTRAKDLRVRFVDVRPGSAEGVLEELSLEGFGLRS